MTMRATFRAVRALLHPGLVSALLLWTLSGCARWVPVEVGSAPPGADVRLRLSDEGAERLAELTGTGASEVTGELVQWEPEVIVSSVLASPSGAAVNSGLRQRLVVDPADVVALDIREIDRTRTRLLVGGVVATVGSAIVWAALNLVRGSEGAPGVPPVDVPSEPFVRVGGWGR